MNLVPVPVDLVPRIFKSVFGIRMFLGLLDPDPDILVRRTDPDPAPDPSLFSYCVDRTELMK
jgi:hypothetical protein